MSAKRRYPTDLTDRQWELIEPLLPEPSSNPGRPAKHPKREIVNAILYHVRAGGSWRMLPKDFPPWETGYGYFRDWRKDGTLDRVHDALREQVRTKHEGRQADPSAGIVDSQSVKGADTVSADLAIQLDPPPVSRHMRGQQSGDGVRVVKTCCSLRARLGGCHLASAGVAGMSCACVLVAGGTKWIASSAETRGYDAGNHLGRVVMPGELTEGRTAGITVDSVPGITTGSRGSGLGSRLRGSCYGRRLAGLSWRVLAL